MQKLWNYISKLGTNAVGIKLNFRTVVLTNQLNFVMLITMSLLLILTLIGQNLTNNVISYGTLKVALTLLLSLLNLIIARYGFTRLSRLSLIFLPSVVFFLIWIFIGYVQEEEFTYYPYLLIGISVIPQLLVNSRKEKFLFWLSLCYYFLLVMFIDWLMVKFGRPGMVEPGAVSYPIVDRINMFYVYYKLSQVGLFLFIAADIYYLRLINYRFEAELNVKNNELSLQNEELKAQKEEIERQQDELVTKEVSTWQKLVHIISHEIVNSAIPITNLAGVTAQLLENESGEVIEPGKAGPEVLVDIHEGLRIIESRTSGLINFVKAAKNLTNLPSPNFRELMITELFERVGILYGPRFKNAGISFKSEIIPEDLCINADLELIEQVVINLIQNSLEALGETSRPELLLTARKEGPHIVLSVIDNGKGISSEIIEKIFLPFYSTKENSSGIGLSLSKQILMLHHARLEVKSAPMEGATFSVVF